MYEKQQRKKKYEVNIKPSQPSGHDGHQTCGIQNVTNYVPIKPAIVRCQ